MTDSEESFPDGLFSNLAPPEPAKIVVPSRPINMMLKKKMERELEMKARKEKKDKVKREQRSRSRDRYQGRKSRYNDQGKFKFGAGGTEQSQNIEESPRAKIEEGVEVIVISDDEERQMYELLQSIHDPIDLSAIDGMNSRQRRKFYRILQRQQRYYRLGKLRDQLSSKVLNTIQDYFR